LETNTLFSLLGIWRLDPRGVIVLGLSLILVIGCGAEAPAGESGSLGVTAFALSGCSSGTQEVSLNKVRVIVSHVAGSSEKKTYDKTKSYNGSGKVGVKDVPEGTDEQVTIAGYDGGDAPVLFGRRKHLIIEQGKSNALSVVMSRYGGFSCPTPATEYTHRLFSAVTDIGNGKYFISGGMTTVDQTSGTTFGTNDGSRKAYIYNSEDGSMVKVANLMNVKRAAHSAVFVSGVQTHKVILFGGTTVMTYNSMAANQFGWSFEVIDALSSVEVYEWSVGSDAAKGIFRSDVGSRVMLKKRVFSTANVISNDGLVLVCGGGVWGGAKDSEYKECDLWDALAGVDDFVNPSNNVMNFYHAGHTSAVLESGDNTKLFVLGGTTEGPVAEIYVSGSSDALRGGDGGTFLKLHIDDVPHSFFHTITPLKDNQFMLIGGVNWNGLSFEPPSEKNAWLITLTDDGGGYVAQSQSIGGLGVGRYFHVAQAPAGRHLTVIGGFTGTSFEVTGDVRFYNPGVGLVPPPDTESPFLARGGMASILLGNDTLLISGGISGVNDLTIDQAGVIEVYTPSHIDLAH
jgi:hypothetical protein